MKLIKILQEIKAKSGGLHPDLEPWINEILKGPEILKSLENIVRKNSYKIASEAKKQASEIAADYYDDDEDEDLDMEDMFYHDQVYLIMVKMLTPYIARIAKQAGFEWDGDSFRRGEGELNIFWDIFNNDTDVRERAQEDFEEWMDVNWNNL